MSKEVVSYKRHRFPREVIAHAVWLYFRFPLSFRLIEEMLLERGLIVSYETIRRWSQKFGAAFARSLRRKAARPGDIWHLDEVRIVIHGPSHPSYPRLRPMEQGHPADSLKTSRQSVTQHTTVNVTAPFDITSHLIAEKPAGWHADMAWDGVAWTSGNAELPLGDHLSNGKMGILSITVRAAGPYIVDNQKTEKTAKSA